MRVVAMCLCLLAGCLQAELVPCADGRACPNGTVCDDVHASCVSPEQITACEGATPLAACDAGSLTGQCFDGVCLEPGCGNRVVEVDETCDDGNREAGDGCAADCRSTESCGNGSRDPGEQCDDGGMFDHDGCTSTCVREPLVTTVHPLAPYGIHSAKFAYDAKRDRVVGLFGAFVWEWDGSKWHFAAPTPLSFIPTTWLYDSDREVVLAYGSGNVAEWDGTTWTVRLTSGSQPVGESIATFLHGRHTVLAIGASSAWLLDTATLVWTGPVSTPFRAHAVAFDRARDRVVAVTARQQWSNPMLPATTWEWDFATWTMVGGGSTADQDQRLVFDEVRGQVVALGGLTLDADFLPELQNAVDAWTGTAWVNTSPPVFPPQTLRGAWFASSRGQLELVLPGQTQYGPDVITVVWSLGALGATEHEILQPALGPATAIAFDIKRDRAVAFDGTRTWVWTDRWEIVPTTRAPSIYRVTLVYDPVRDAVIAVDEASTMLWQFDTDWQQLAIPTPATAGFDGAAYDYSERRIVFGGYETWALDSDGTAPVRVTSQPSADPVFDTSRGVVVYLDANGTLRELVGDQWEQTLSPGQGYQLVSSLHRGSIIVERTGGGEGWERRAGVWSAVTRSAIGGCGSQPAIGERANGTIVWLCPGLVAEQRYVATTSASETCTTSDDADNDGLAGCDDRDCWATCTPACPPSMSCL